MIAPIPGEGDVTRLKLFLAALAALLPVPAFADVTAHYLAGGKTEVTVEVASAGNSRIDIGGKFAIIRRDATDYIVVQDKEGPKVFELKEAADFVKAVIPKGPNAKDEGILFAISAGPALSVAGRPGAGWMLEMVKGPDAEKKKRLEFVLSADSALAPVGDVLRRTVDLALEVMGDLFPAETGFGTRLTELFAKGTPLKVTAIEPGAAKPEEPVLEFRLLDTASIDAKRFELPAPVTSIDQLMGMLGSGTPGSQGPVEDLP